MKYVIAVSVAGLCGIALTAAAMIPQSPTYCRFIRASSFEELTAVTGYQRCIVFVYAEWSIQAELAKREKLPGLLNRFVLQTGPADAALVELDVSSSHLGDDWEFDWLHNVRTDQYPVGRAATLW